MDYYLFCMYIFMVSILLGSSLILLHKFHIMIDIIFFVLLGLHLNALRHLNILAGILGSELYLITYKASMVSIIVMLIIYTYFVLKRVKG